MKVSWDDDIPNIWKVIKAMSQTTNQFFILSFYHLMFFTDHSPSTKHKLHNSTTAHRCRPNIRRHPGADDGVRQSTPRHGGEFCRDQMAVFDTNKHRGPTYMLLIC